MYTFEWNQSFTFAWIDMLVLKQAQLSISVFQMGKVTSIPLNLEIWRSNFKRKYNSGHFFLTGSFWIRLFTYNSPMFILSILYCVTAIKLISDFNANYASILMQVILFFLIMTAIPL